MNDLIILLALAAIGLYILGPSLHMYRKKPARRPMAPKPQSNDDYLGN